MKNKILLIPVLGIAFLTSYSFASFGQCIENVSYWECNVPNPNNSCTTCLDSEEYYSCVTPYDELFQSCTEDVDEQINSCVVESCDENFDPDSEDWYACEGTCNNTYGGGYGECDNTYTLNVINNCQIPMCSDSCVVAGGGSVNNSGSNNTGSDNPGGNGGGVVGGNTSGTGIITSETVSKMGTALVTGGSGLLHIFIQLLPYAIAFTIILILFKLVKNRSKLRNPYGRGNREFRENRYFNPNPSKTFKNNTIKERMTLGKKHYYNK